MPPSLSQVEVMVYELLVHIQDTAWFVEPRHKPHPFGLGYLTENRSVDTRDMVR